MGRRGAIAAVLGLLALGETIARAVAGRGGDDDMTVQFGLLLAAVALATTVPLVRRRPAGAAVAVTGASLLALVPLHCLTVAGALGVVVALYRLGRSGAHVLAGSLGLPFLMLALTDLTRGAERALVVLLAVVAPAAAWAGTTRWAQSEAHAHRSAQQTIAGTALAHAARGERARISRELHDVVAHHISIIAVQAETARLTTAGLPDAGAQQLSAIGHTARAALTEMRRLLGVLRDDVDAEPAHLQPQPGLRELNELLDAARDASGNGTRLILRGAPVTLDPGVELATYRIVQEALTNARRHALGAAVDVELHYTEPGLRLRIRDNGPGPPPTVPAGGHGLLGMHERALAVGGSLQAGAAPGGGFLVTASLPGKGDEDG